MAFNLDTTDPTDISIGSAFPANERAFRGQVQGYLGTEHDINTGYHAFQLLSTTSKNALTTPPTGMLVYDSTLSQGQINSGTSASPSWTNFTSRAQFWSAEAGKSSNYQMLSSDLATLFTNNGASGTVTLTLPTTSTITVGWFVGIFTYNTDQLNVSVQGSAGEKILVAANQTLTTLAMPTYAYESAIIAFDGSNFEVIAGSPDVFVNNNAAPQLAAAPYLNGTAYTNSGTHTLQAGAIKVTAVGAGGGGNSGGGGGSGAGFVYYLSGLTAGNTLTVTIGASGGVGGNGGNTVISSGTQSITSATAGGGTGASATNSGNGGTTTGGTLQMNGDNGTTNTGGKLGLIGTYGAGGVGGYAYYGGQYSIGAGNGQGGAMLIEWVNPP